MSLKSADDNGTRLRERVLETVQRVLGENYHPQLRKLELNSLKMLELIVALEEEFGIHISEDASLAHITSSIDRIVEFLLTVKLPDEPR
jgi:acyl carrier protein